MQQIAVRGMDLHGIDAQVCRSARGRGKAVDDLLHARSIQGNGGMVVSRKRDSRWRHRLPAALVTGRKLSAAAPGQIGGSLATRVGELQSDRHLRPTPHAVEYVTHCRG